MAYKLVTKQREIEDYIGSSELLALDIETSPNEKYRDEPKSALDSHKSTITGISFSVSHGTGIYIPFRHRNGENADFKTIWSFIEDEILMDPKIIVVIHNLAFESAFFYALGIIPQCKIYDTMAAAQMTLKNETQFRNLADSGLKTLVPELLEIELPKFEVVTNGKFFDELDSKDPETIRYACADSDYALRLYHYFNDWFDKNLPKHKFIVEKIESPTAVYVGLMKHNGLLMDVDLMLQKQKESEQILTKLHEKLNSITGVEVGKNASTKAFKEFLYKQIGLPIFKKTEKNSEAVDDEAILLLEGYCKTEEPDFVPLLEMVREYRKIGKIKSTYIDGYLPHINSATGRIHAELFPLATDTGRFASRNPNLQNCPRKDNDPIGVRNFIITPKGKVLLSLDFSQIELRVGAFYCRDKAMLETYRNGGDIHAKTTSVIYKIPFEEAVDKNSEHYKERRTIAKACNFGVFFGLYPNGLLRSLKFKAHLNKTLNECREIINNLKEGYPGLVFWQHETIANAKFSGFTETFLGRRRYLPEINSLDRNKKSFAQRCALNTPIQGTAADILKLAIVRILHGLQERIWLKPLLQIHDELIFELPKEKLDEAVQFVKGCMEVQPFSEFDVSIVVQASFGTNFGNLKEIEEVSSCG
ncbi:MAG: bifunctional 3'-5' exonuclease/DNA polymerase [Oscillospiraceae bacterium]|jgi:DNA polymerase-1|nr:bifunctional 3'-5' exonuclease/DNA polymerase [Oscillospiraceae bacterium]